LLIVGTVVLSVFHVTAQQAPPPQSAQPKTTVAATPPAAPAPTPRGPLIGDYIGILPCKDCLSMRAELMLYAASADAANYGTYTLVQNYVSAKRSGLPWIETYGRWALAYGTPEDPGAVLYQLTGADPAASPQYFLRVSDNMVRILDPQRRVFAPISSSTLTRLPVRVPGQRRQ
jgi:hypothetical protein